MNRIRNLVTNLLARRARTSLMLRRVRRGMESRLPLAAPVFTHLLDRPREKASSNGTNGNGHRRKMTRAHRRTLSRPFRSAPGAMSGKLIGSLHRHPWLSGYDGAGKTVSVRSAPPSRRRHPLAMVLGFTLPIGNGRGSSRLHIRTLFRLER